MRRRVWITAAIVLLGVAGALAYHFRSRGEKPEGRGPFGPTKPTRAPRANETRPNIVMIVTDDQENATLRFMPKTRALLSRQGVQFNDAQVSDSLCCPSRATILTGQYAHNHRVRDNAPPLGGWHAFNANGAEAKALPVAMQRAGYNTSFVGKYLNGWADGREDPSKPGTKAQPIPPGWNSFIGLVGRSVYSMWGYTLDNNGRLKQYPKDPSNASAYQTDVLDQLAVDQIHSLAKSPRPFMLDVFPASPHTEKNSAVQRGEIRPAPRYRTTYLNQPLRRTPSFNEADLSDKPPYIRSRRIIPPDGIARMTVEYQERLGALRSIDDMVGNIVRTLAQTGKLENTVIAFSSDNGYLLGQHRIFNGKIVPYGDSMRVPLILRGPGFQRGAQSRAVAANLDLAPTFLQLAQARALLPPDGISLLPILEGKASGTGRDLLLENYISSSAAEGGASASGLGDKYEPYKALRTSRWLYVVYADPHQGIELYDLSRDPDNLHNLAYDPRYAGVRNRLNRRLDAIKSCAGPSCRRGRVLRP